MSKIDEIKKIIFGNIIHDREISEAIVEELTMKIMDTVKGSDYLMHRTIKQLLCEVLYLITEDLSKNMEGMEE